LLGIGARLDLVGRLRVTTGIVTAAATAAGIGFVTSVYAAALVDDTARSDAARALGAIVVARAARKACIRAADVEGAIDGAGFGASGARAIASGLGDLFA